MSTTIRVATSATLCFSSFNPAEIVYQAASCFTTPLCQTRELYVQIRYGDSLDATTAAVAKWAKNFWLFVQLVCSATTAFLTTLPGIALRAIGNLISENPFTYKQGEGPEKAMGAFFTLLSWNICCVPAGYCITDGGVTPWHQRIHLIAEKIRQSDADVVSLYEVMDYDAGKRLYEELKGRYAHFYFNIGAQAVGPSSGIFIASKFPITDPKFIRFPKEILSGRAKHSGKGVFSFGIPHARIFSTHIQHSEIPANPEKETEVPCRAQQMNRILREMQEAQEEAVILTGDLNLDSQEYEESTWKEHFKGVVHFEETKTWGGDHLCARMAGKEVSEPCNLDYTVALQRSTARIETQQLETGFDSTAYQEGITSDHNALLSTIYREADEN